jgi:hypothetical protein
MTTPVYFSFPNHPWVTTKLADHGQPHIEHFLATYRDDIRHMRQTGIWSRESGHCVFL